MINVLHMSPWPLGGSTSYVVNLAKTFEKAEIPYRIVRLAKRTEGKKRQIGEYGVWYQNVAFESAVKGKGIWLLASAPTDESLAAQCIELVENSNGSYVFHDPNEFKLYPHWNLLEQGRTANKVVCIRETGLDSMPRGEFIPHPYVRVCADKHDGRTRHAISIARTSAVKHSDWIFEANAKLPERLRVTMYGELNRMWWNFNVTPKHPEWPMPTLAGFPRKYGEAAKLCASATYMVDMTIFNNDGGGTQYTLLEAMDAGAIPILTSQWCGYKGPAKKFGFSVINQHELASALQTPREPKLLQSMRESNWRYVDKVHNPHTIAQRYASHLMSK